MTDAKTTLAGARRLVLKFGSALVAGPDGAPVSDNLARFAADIAALRKRGCAVMIVTSGAVTLGRAALDITPSAKAPSTLSLDQKQAAAAIGQVPLMEAWRKALSVHALPVAQMLITLDDTEDRKRYLNMRATLEALLEAGVIPIINENDTVATSEIRYGDNDRLAAHAAQMSRADILVLASDVDGVYTANPQTDNQAQHLSVIDAITPDIHAMAAGPNAQSGTGSGGMVTKLAAANIAGRAGIPTIITKGTGETAHTIEGPVSALEKGARATLILPSVPQQTARRQWIAGRQKPKGTLLVDAGAINALKAGKSLLCAGVTGTSGQFSRGALVNICAGDSTLIAQGITAYGSDEAAKLVGVQSDAIETVLGYRGRAAIIHRDDLALHPGLTPAPKTVTD